MKQNYQALSPASWYGELQPHNFVAYDAAFLERLDFLLLRLQSEMESTHMDFFGSTDDDTPVLQDGSDSVTTQHDRPASESGSSLASSAGSGSWDCRGPSKPTFDKLEEELRHDQTEQTWSSSGTISKQATPEEEEEEEEEKTQSPLLYTPRFAELIRAAKENYFNKSASKRPQVMSAHEPHEQGGEEAEDDDEMFDPADAEEEIPEGDDMPMSDDEDQMMDEIHLQNDSIAHFDSHKDSIFCIAQHPTNPAMIATGGGDDVGYIFDATPPPNPVLPASFQSNPQPVERKSLEPTAKLEGHSDSINAIAFTQPNGEFVITAGLDGRINAYKTPTQPQAASLKAFATAQEVEEINWLLPCPHPSYPNAFALGALDGSVWVYTINPSDPSPLTIVQAFYLHQGSCTAGAWTPDGKLLATVSEDASLYVWDVFGDAAAAGLSNQGQAVVGLTGEDERFRVDGGLFSCAISPGGAIVAVGGADGNIRIVGLPRLSVPAAASVTSGAKGAGARGKAGGAKQAGGPRGGQSTAASGQAGVILASLQAQTDGIESLCFSQPPLTLLAAGSVDGSVALYDAAHNFAVRRHIKEAHEEEAVIKVEFVYGGGNDRNWLLTSCGNDGVVRRWDVRGGTAAAGMGIHGEWKGHRGGGEGGGILGFVQGAGGNRIITAGDDGISLVFNAP